MTTENEVVVEPVAPVTPAAEDTYEKEFDALVAKRESDKDGTSEPVKEPATEAPVVETKEPAVEAAEKKTAAPPAAEPDWLTALPEEHRNAARAALTAESAATAKAAKLELDNRSLAGRMSAYQRRYEEAAGKRPVEVAAKATAEQSVEWTQFKTDYPDIAKAIEARVPAQAGASPELAQVVEFVQQEKRERFLHDAWDAVETVHPKWRELGVTPAFQEWKASSPTYEKLASSDDIADAVALFDLYKAHHPAQAVDPTQAAAAVTLAARREAQAEGAQASPNKTQSPNHGVDLTDPDQLFAFYADKANSRMRKRNQ